MWIRVKETVRFAIDGEMPERFINIANRRRLRIFNLHVIDGRMYGFIGAGDFPLLREAAGKAGVTLSVTDRLGLVPRLRRYRHRAGFVLGAGLFCLILWYLSLFVWFVETENVPDVYAVSVSDALQQAGLRTGVLTSSVEGDLLEKELEAGLPQFRMIRVTRMGCRARVQFIPLRTTTPKAADNTPCDLIADDAGEIVSVIACAGLPLVKPGDVVYPGDTLISGLFNGQGDRNTLVHAEGSVTALVEYTCSTVVPFRQTVTVPTGRVVHIHRPMLFGLEIPLFGEKPRGLFRRSVREVRPDIPGLSLPFVLRNEDWTELCYVEKNIPEETCIDQGEAELRRKLSVIPYEETVSSDRRVTPVNGGIRVTRHYVLLREISQTRPLLYNDSELRQPE